MSDNLPGTAIVVQAIGMVVSLNQTALDDQGDTVKLLMLQGKHGEAAVVRNYPADAYQDLAKRARLSLAAARQAGAKRRRGRG